MEYIKGQLEYCIKLRELDKVTLVIYIYTENDNYFIYKSIDIINAASNRDSYYNYAVTRLSKEIEDLFKLLNDKENNPFIMLHDHSGIVQTSKINVVIPYLQEYIQIISAENPTAEEFVQHILNTDIESIKKLNVN